MPFVLDNSVVTGWYLPDQASSYSQAIATLLESDKALVPTLWQQELANVLTRVRHQIPFFPVFDPSTLTKSST